MEEVSLLTQKHLLLHNTTTDKHGVPPMKRLFKVAMLDPSPNLLVHGERLEIQDYQLWPSKLCAPTRPLDDMPFHIQACTEYTDGCFVKLYGRPERYAVEMTWATKSGDEDLRNCKQLGVIRWGGFLDSSPFRQSRKVWRRDFLLLFFTDIDIKFFRAAKPPEQSWLTLPGSKAGLLHSKITGITRDVKGQVLIVATSIRSLGYFILRVSNSFDAFFKKINGVAFHGGGS
ncbi:hypothetical protein Tco_0180068 [Tanacetum coccineum]